MAKRKNSREIGSRTERQLVKIFTNWWGGKFYRTPRSGAFGTAGYTEFSGDILTDDPSFPFCVESKKGEGWHLEQILTGKKDIITTNWWVQTVHETPEGKRPLLVFTRNHQPFFYLIRQKDLPLAFEDSYFQFTLDGEKLCLGLLEGFMSNAPEIWK